MQSQVINHFARLVVLDIEMIKVLFDRSKLYKEGILRNPLLIPLHNLAVFNNKKLKAIF
jgi:hypothetical protein